VANRDVGSIHQLDAVLAKVDTGRSFSVLFRREEWVQYAVIKPVK
jgi:serine protease Do